MKLSEKIKYLREVEGSMRGLDRAMTQQELVRAIKAELKTSMSQSYLSQIESGARPHLTNTTRQILAKFFKVHPGYLVEDPTPEAFAAWVRQILAEPLLAERLSTGSVLRARRYTWTHAAHLLREVYGELTAGRLVECS